MEPAFIYYVRNCLYLSIKEEQAGLKGLPLPYIPSSLSSLFFSYSWELKKRQETDGMFCAT